MFYFFSQGKMKRFLFAGLVLFLLTALFGGCKLDGAEDDVNQPGTLPGGLVGKWTTAYDYFEISKSANTEIVKYDDGGYGFGYEGIIKFVSNYDSKSGVIIIQYTTGAPDAARPFHAIYYLDFTGRTISLNNTFDATAADYNADAATLEEAAGKFTKGNMGNYIDASMAPEYTGIPGNTNP